jgi:hypothetical protein
MNFLRAFGLVALLCLGTTGMIADTLDEFPPPELGHFTIGGDGWIGDLGNLAFAAHANTHITPDNTFFENCFGPGCSLELTGFKFIEDDPTLHINLGGSDQGVGKTFDFSVNNGVLDVHLVNVSGETFTDLQIVVNVPQQGLTYQCNDDNNLLQAFSSCFIQVLDPQSNRQSALAFDSQGDSQVTFLFLGPPGIPSAVPEPGSWVLLMTGAGAALWTRRKRKL